MSCLRIPPALLVLLIPALALGAARPCLAGPAEEDQSPVAPSVAPAIRVGAAPT